MSDDEDAARWRAVAPAAREILDLVRVYDAADDEDERDRLASEIEAMRGPLADLVVSLVDE